MIDVMDRSDLKGFRKKIDGIDNEIIELLSQRIKITKSVDELKKMTGAPRYDATRWQSASQKRALHAKQLKAPQKLVGAVFDDIHKYVLDDVYKMPQALYLGPEGSFSHIAAKKLVDLGQYRLKACASWRDLYTQLRLSPDNIAVVPIENSISSNIHANVDALFEGDLYILGQTNIDIGLGLFAKNGTDLGDIKHIYSHPQALMQATKKIQDHHWQQHEASSTSAALAYIRNSPEDDVACLAPVGSVAPGIHQLCENFQDLTVNQTRFITISTKKPLNQNGNKASVLFEIKHETGSLEQLLQFLADQKYNLTKIESRPIPTRIWAYKFWIDFQSISAVNSESIKSLLSREQIIDSFTVLGIY